MRANYGIAFLLGLAWFVACSPDPARGPGKIIWDRDGCEYCRMTISDRRFATQVRTAQDHKLHRFDDLGCALLFLDQLRQHDSVLETKSDAELFEEIWVRDMQGADWKSAAEMGFHDAYTTPMGYGYAPAGAPSAETLTLMQVWERVRAKENERRHHGHDGQ